jgi:hypothetical protein
LYFGPGFFFSNLKSHANFASAYVQALKAKLAVDLGQQYLNKILLLKQLAKTPNGTVIWHAVSEAMTEKLPSFDWC